MFPRLDIILLVPEQGSKFEYKTVAKSHPYQGELYIQLGFSDYYQWPSTLSSNMGVITNNCTNDRQHIRGSTGPCDGDSGAPIFSFFTGKLLGISVGCHYNESLPGHSGLKAVIVPVNIISLLVDQMK